MAESNAADGRKKHWLRWIEKSKELCGRDGILCDSVFSARNSDKNSHAEPAEPQRYLAESNAADGRKRNWVKWIEKARNCTGKMEFSATLCSPRETVIRFSRRARGAAEVFGSIRRGGWVKEEPVQLD